MTDLFIILGLIILNGLFSMSETAVISARKSRLEQEARRGNRAAGAALDIASNPDRFLSTIQIGITLIGILTGLYSGARFASLLATVFVDMGMDFNVALEVAQVVIVSVVTYLSIVIGELVPKRIALNSPDSIAKGVARPMALLSRVSMPLVWLLSVSTKALVRLLNLRGDESKITEGDVKQIIENGAASGEVQPVEKDIMNRTLMLGDQRVASIMTCRKDVIALNTRMTALEVKERVASELHDTYPVFDDEGVDVIGTVSLKDLIFKVSMPDFRLVNHITPGNYIPESMSVYNALERLKTSHIHCLMVCDEFGVMQGVVTLNDVLDGLVGNADETQQAPFILRRDDGSCLVDGRCPVYDFLCYYDCEDLYEPATYSSVAGLILELTRRMPVEGDKVHWRCFTFEIVDMDHRRIDKLLVTRSQE